MEPADSITLATYKSRLPFFIIQYQKQIYKKPIFSMKLIPYRDLYGKLFIHLSHSCSVEKKIRGYSIQYLRYNICCFCLFCTYIAYGG